MKKLAIILIALFVLATAIGAFAQSSDIGRFRGIDFIQNGQSAAQIKARMNEGGMFYDEALDSLFLNVNGVWTAIAPGSGGGGWTLNGTSLLTGNVEIWGGGNSLTIGYNTGDVNSQLENIRLRGRTTAILQALSDGLFGSEIDLSQTNLFIGNNTDVAGSENTVRTMVIYEGGTGAGTPAAGMGYSLDYRLPNDAFNHPNVSRDVIVFTDPTDGAEDAERIFSVIQNGSLVERLILSPDEVAFPSEAGVGTRMATISATGVLGTAALPTGATPGGASGNVQYNDGAGGFAGESTFTYDPTGNDLTIEGLIVTELTAGRNTFATTGDRLADDSDWTFNPTGNVVTLTSGKFTSSVTDMLIESDAGNDITLNAGDDVILKPDNGVGIPTVTLSATSTNAAIVSSEALDLASTGSGNNVNITAPSSADVNVTGNDDVNIVAEGDDVVISAFDDTQILAAGDLQLGSSSTDGLSTSGIVYSSTYTPSYTGLVNVDAVTAYDLQYIRVGNVVTLSGRVDVDPTANTTTTGVRFTIPVASAFSQTYHAGGGGGDSSVGGGGNFSYCVINANAANDELELYFRSNGTGSSTYYFSATYLIL